MSQVKVNNRIYTVKEELDMSNYPNTAKHIKRTLYLEGKKNAQLSLSQRVSGTWYYQNLHNGCTNEARVEFI